MEELLELKACIQDGRYGDALALIGEMEEMSREDKINRIESFLDVLLVHLIKRYAEKRSTRSWDASIYHAVRQIEKINKRRKAGGYYLTENELADSMEEGYPAALKYASLEAFGGALDEEELGRKVDEGKVKQEALSLLLEKRREKRK